MRVIGKDLEHSFPGTGILFRGLSFEFAAGELVGLTGPSGSGKSTLLSLLALWERPKAGSVTWEGIDDVGWVFQNPHGVAGRTALDHVVLPLLALGLTRRDAVVQAEMIMARFALAELAGRRFGALSGGESQRLMLARAVAKSPCLLLVDEPTAQLDPVASATVNTVLGELADERMIVVVATHDPQTAAACTRRVDLGSGVPELAAHEH